MIPPQNIMTAEDDANSGYSGATLTGNVLTNDLDPDGNGGVLPASSVEGASAPINSDGSYGALTVGTTTLIYGEDPNNPGSFIPAGTITLESDGSYTFISDPNFDGTVLHTLYSV